MKVFRSKAELEAEIARRIKESEKLEVGSEEWERYCTGTARLAEATKYFGVSPDTTAKIGFGALALLWTTWYQKNNILDIKPIRVVADSVLGFIR